MLDNNSNSLKRNVNGMMFSGCVSLATNCDVAELFMKSSNHDFIIVDLRNSYNNRCISDQAIGLEKCAKSFAPNMTSLIY